MVFFRVCPSLKPELWDWLCAAKDKSRSTGKLPPPSLRDGNHGQRQAAGKGLGHWHSLLETHDSRETTSTKGQPKKKVSLGIFPQNVNWWPQSPRMPLWKRPLKIQSLAEVHCCFFFSLRDINKEAIKLHIVHAPWVESYATLMIFMCSY